MRSTAWRRLLLACVFAVQAAGRSTAVAATPADTGVAPVPPAPLGPQVPGSSSAPGSPALDGGGVCLGDCNGDGAVTVNEIIVMVNIALGVTPCCTSCAAADPNNTGAVIVTQIISAVNSALN